MTVIYYSREPVREKMMTAKYVKLADTIREQIKSGELRPGDKLPSISQLREEYGISYGSVRGAMLVLKAEGLIEGRQGEAVYVKDREAS
jgi:DNA-binding GntR family transcriptional regulator